MAENASQNGIINQLYFDGLPYSSIIARNKATQPGSRPSLKVGILRNITVDNYLPLLKYVLSKQFSVELQQGEFDVIIQEALDPQMPMNRFAPDVLIVFLNIRQIAPDLWYRYPSLSPGEIDAEKASVVQYVQNLLEAFHRNSRCKVIFNLFELPPHPALDLAEMQTRNGQRELIDGLNREVLSIARQVPDIYLADLNVILEKLGASHYFDKRYWYMGKAPYTLEALKEIAVEHVKIIHSLYGKTKKCLVLDCDNTLWGGIIGEDGMRNIRIGKTFPGNMFLDFQQAILNLSSKGVILAICSKNNESDVMEVLENHPDMLLRKNNFACIYANWNNKADNIRNIALDLNIGLDSIVFVDDSEFESNLVRDQVEGVTVITLPKEASGYAELLQNCGLFDKLNYTSEDRKRGDLYRVNVERDKLKTSFSDLHSYYRSLEMVIDIEPVDEFSAPRASQLTQRTNQFNLTTRRYSVDDITGFMRSPDHEVLLLKLSDKFGDMGIVGLQIIDYTEHGKAKIDSFMMSCRIIGRGVENVFLRTAVRRSLDREAAQVEGQFIRTGKNALASEFYRSNGFGEVSGDGTVFTYRLKDAGQLPAPVDYFKEINIK